MKKIIIFTAIFILITACSKVPITGRKQTRLLPESELMAMSLTQYQQFLKENQLSTNQAQAQMVKNVGDKIRKAAETYYAKTGRSKELTGYKWEYNLVNSPEINAWCMPGGKVVVYSGIMPVTKDEDGLAVVMGHEIAHALARHGNERMSQALLAQAGGMALSVALSSKPQQTQDLFMQAYGVGATVGALLPFSRLQESEADQVGLYLMAMAGYNPDVAGDFWKRMEAASGGGKMPGFLSTHPDPSKRSENLVAMAPKAKAFAQKYR
ncbi:MAG: M48 family metallopeptidase [Bacteroidia bacterium]|nr:M48 family metallopeptidase [Bacteroidia bacterium]